MTVAVLDPAVVLVGARVAPSVPGTRGPHRKTVHLDSRGGRREA